MKPSGKSFTLSTRITPELRVHLERASRKSGRTLSQEVEGRLRETFREEKELTDRFGTYHTALVMQVVALVLRDVNPDGDWLRDPYAFQLAKKAIDCTLALVRPKEEDSR